METTQISVISRDGEIRNFDISRIENAVSKAYAAVAHLDSQAGWPSVTPHNIAVKVREKIISSIAELNTEHGIEPISVEIERIQDAVEQTLMEMELFKQAKAYMLYRSKHGELRSFDAAMLDISNTMDGYLGKSDWRVNENANVNYSLGGLILHNSGAITANYWLNSIYSPEVAKAHKSAAFHIHDLSMFSGYCAGWSLRQLIAEGLGGVRGKISSTPAKHLVTLVQQMVNFLGIMQNEWAGAQAFSSFDTYLAPFVREDGLDQAGVKQALQSFIYGVNTPSRWGSQAPFTNITLDWMVPGDLADKAAVVGGIELDYSYGDLQAEMDMINRAFLELMIEGDASGRGFQYPIPTYNITKDFAWNSENAELLFRMTGKYGTPYFQNFVNSDLNPGDVRSMCCRLQLDKRELRKRGGGLFGSDEFTGSIGVVTINLPQIAHLAADRHDFLARLDELMNLASESLETKRVVVQKLLDQGLFPYTKRYLSHLNNHFSTIGIVGMNEATENFMGKNLLDNEARAFALEILDHMRSRMADLQESTGSLYNLEASPAEGTSYRLALHDTKNHPGIITAGTEEQPFYTNSTQLPVDATADILDALDLQDDMQSRYTGGTVFHGFLGESIKDWRACADLVRIIAHNYRLPYFTISPTFSICPVHGYLDGEVHECPHCSGETEVYSRIVGYYRALKNWNQGKSREFVERKTYVHTIDSAGMVRPDTPTIANTLIAKAEAAHSAPSLEYYFTPSCPKCPSVKSTLENVAANFTPVDAASEGGAILAAENGISSVPTVIARDRNGREVFRSSDLNRIAEYIRK
ncbi:ribonucleoside triphosphate reductase [Salinispira pacifica]|uniref:Ribonucleotide reductase of class III (Anaerobic), large subunit n=1 Tax=Salinispira pacifica TaxID=1307761 RepID=V5WN77_9SPIO|nr:ribonucleoside triphosphate reductase [Salinispira pacifica]AHC16659.1 Ribonucleotide reductase of class III (anaerobic), large subunit [Salinispira pacifica]